MRRVLRVYPRDFRRQLSTDMGAVFAREVERVFQQRGRWAALRHAVGTLLVTLAGALPAHWNRHAPPETLMDALLQDLRYAFRNMLRSPGFTAVAVGSLALGIGATTAIFSVFHAVLLRPLPFEDPARLMILWESNEEIGIARYGPSGPNFLDWRERSRAFDSMALLQPGSATITGLAEPEQVPGMRVTTNFLSLLGFRPALGRDFLPEESRGGRRNVVILSHGFWQRAFAGDAAIIGRELMGDHIPYTVIGVLPEDFWYPLRVDLLAPWDEDELVAQDRADREYAAMGRLRDGVSLAAARAEMEEIGSQLQREHAQQEGWGIQVAPVAEEGAAYLRPALVVLLGAVAFVLLIACANVANLLLARGTSRQRELAVRAATGASRGRLVRQLLAESCLLAASGGVLGWLVGIAGVAGLRNLLPAEVPLPGGVGSILLPNFAPDGTVLAFTLAVSLLTGVLFGLAPAWQLSIVDLAQALRASHRRSGRGGGRGGLRAGLVAGEVALAVVVLVGTCLMIQSFWHLARVELGFVPDDVLTLQIELPTDSKYRTDAERAEFYRQTMALLAEIPTVDSVGISEVLPLDTVTRRTSLQIEGDPVGGRELGTGYNLASAGFFEALGIPLLAGRAFDDHDDLDGEHVVLVDAAFVQAYFPDTDPVGSSVIVWGAPRRIIGVVGSVRNVALDSRPEPTVYVHYLQSSDNMMTLLVRSRGEFEPVVKAAKEAVWEIDPEQPVFNVRRMRDVVAGRASSTRMTLALLGVFGAVAVGMAALGVYGVMSYTVGQRTHELGVRQALGARGRDLLRMLIGEAALLACGGVVLGVGLSLALNRGMASLLYGVNTTQPAAYVTVVIFLFAVAAAATWVPARRAARVHPLIALRSE